MHKLLSSSSKSLKAYEISTGNVSTSPQREQYFLSLIQSSIAIIPHSHTIASYLSDSSKSLSFNARAAP